jgi:hypothetical protein
MENEYLHRIVYENGEYIIYKGNSGTVDGDDPNEEFPESFKVLFPAEAEWILYNVISYNEENYEWSVADDYRALNEEQLTKLIVLLEECAWEESELSVYADSDYVFFIDGWETDPYEVAYDADTGTLMLWMYDVEAQVKETEEFEEFLASILANA